MLRISKLADYSSVIMTHLAASGVRLTAKQIAISTKISHPTVTKLLKILSKTDFLSSTVGNQGGYKLAKPAEQITLLDIINSIEGDFYLTECSKNIVICNIYNNCQISKHWKAINSFIKDTLQGVALSDLILDRKSIS